MGFMRGEEIMLTLEEVLADAAMAPGFEDAENIGVNSRGAEGQTPLRWMATLGDAAGIRLLLDAGASIDAADNDGNTPLHEAVLCRQTAAARELIDHGADLLLKNNSRATP